MLGGLLGCCCKQCPGADDVVLVDAVHSFSAFTRNMPLDDYEAPSIPEDSPPLVLRPLGPLHMPPPDPEDYVEFDAALDKTGGRRLGLDISAYDGTTLLIGKVKPGPVEKWNLENAGRSERVICRGDRVVEVNGVSRDSDGLLGAARADFLNVKIRRLMAFTVTIEYNGFDALGLQFADAPGGQGVVVSLVERGVAEETNELNPADVEIRPGDRVIQFNGRDATTADEIRTATLARTTAGSPGFLTFRLRRPGSLS